METEKIQRPIKIIKKHLKTNKFDRDIYILNYQISIFGIKIWREFPIYFSNEEILKDFIETAYIFNFEFSCIYNCSINLEGFTYYIVTKNFIIYFRNTLLVMGKYHIFNNSYSDFVIKENKEEYATIYASSSLSTAYESYINDSFKYGLSESLEEKTYRLALEKN